MQIGVVLRRTPGATRWASHAWRAVAVLPGAPPGGWKEIARNGDAIDYHAGTVPLVLHRAETEGYLVALNAKVPTVWAILRREAGGEARPSLVAVTASAHAAQDHTDNGEDIVEPIEMPEGLAGWVAEFVHRHHRDEVFVKRKRKPHMDGAPEPGPIAAPSDVYRAPGERKR